MEKYLLYFGVSICVTAIMAVLIAHFAPPRITDKQIDHAISAAVFLHLLGMCVLLLAVMATAWR